MLGNISIVFYLWGGIQSSTGADAPSISEEKEGSPHLGATVSTTKKDLQVLINEFLQQNVQHNAVQYEVLLEDHVEVTGTIEIFTKEIHYSISLNPEVLENGDLLLRPEAIKFGDLQIPVQLVFSQLKQDLFPEWVEVYEQESFIYLAFSKVTFQEKYQVSIEKFDLEENDLVFNIDVVESIF